MKHRPPAEPDHGRRRILSWLWRLPVVAALAGAGYALYEGSRVILGKQAAGEPSFEPRPPVEVAPLAAFAKHWSSVRFELQGEPCVALRLPEPVAGGLSSDGAHLAGFSRICTHQGCTISLNRDLEAIAFAFNYRTETPELVCPCHLSVFSPTRGGQAVSGPAVKPLPRVQLRLEEGRVKATGIETKRADT